MRKRKRDALFRRWPNARRTIVFESGELREFAPRTGQLWAAIHRNQAERVSGLLAACYDDAIVVFTENLRQRVQRIRTP